MKSVLFALLALTPCVLAENAMLIISLSESSPVNSDTVTATFTFSDTVSGFDRTDVEINGEAYGGELTTSISNGQAVPSQFTMPISRLATGESYTVTVAEGAVDVCEFNARDGSCTVTGRDVNDSSEMSFSVFIGEVPVRLSGGNTSPIITTGSTVVSFTTTFERAVTPVSGADAVWAFDNSNNPLAVVDIFYNRQFWTYRIAGRNGAQIQTGLDAAAAKDAADNLSAVSQPSSVKKTLAIRQDCVVEYVWSDWGICDPVSATQTRQTRVGTVVNAQFGGRVCTTADTAIKFESRDCSPVAESLSCLLSVGNRCAAAPSADDICDCTPECVTQSNGLPCCDDVNTVCGLGCETTGCDRMIQGVDGEPICSCDYQCKDYDDCCSDFDTFCQGKLCGTYYMDGEDVCGDNGYFNEEQTCFCEPLCVEYGDCCSDYFRLCDVSSTCAKVLEEDFNGPIGQWDKCDKTFADCGCDIMCPYYGDCCGDYETTCAYNSPLPDISTFIDFGEVDISNVVISTGNRNAPPETCDCVAAGLGAEDCCDSQVGYLGRRCSCASDCQEWADCCDDYARVC